MTGHELLDLLKVANRRSHIIGTPENGIIIGLDLEGRLFTVLNNRVLNRVVPSSIINRSNKNEYLNPGGDALWPAPEGTCFGYEYSIGEWRVPPEITSAVWEVVKQTENSAFIRTEIDLINNQQFGIPCEFERHIKIEYQGKSQIQHVTEMIRYIGVKTLYENEFLLAPWSLCQFDVIPGSKVIMPPPSQDDIWDMYEPSLSKRGIQDDKYVIDAETDFRFQLGLGANIPWVEYTVGNDVKIRRYSGVLPAGHSLIDIADSPPDKLPSNRGVNLSIYCDPSGFMEIEGCGGCPKSLIPGIELSVNICTEYILK